MIGALTIESCSLSVSADPGTVTGSSGRRSHVRDATTGRPAESDLCVAVACGPDEMKCEALIALDLRHSDLETLFASINGRLVAGSGLQFVGIPGPTAWFGAPAAT